MKGGVAWYLRDELRVVSRLVDACCAEGITIANPANGLITYLDDRAGFEGEQVPVARQELLEVLGRRLDEDRRFTFQFWAGPDLDLVCEAERIVPWSSYAFTFDFDGFSSAEAADAAGRLYRARRVLARDTILWLEDAAGMTVEHGPPHGWDGDQRPAWPPARSRD